MEKTILIVDDAAPVRQLLASALSKRGYSVTTAESAQVALEKLLPVTSLPWFDRKVVPQILSFCDDLITSVPIYELHFKPDAGVANLLEEFIK